nr:hypothetical protein [Raineya sp.]
LGQGVSGGINNFVGNITKHLQTGIFDWLTGSVGGAGIQMPAAWDLGGVIFFISQMLGVGWEQIKMKLGAQVGQENMAQLETAIAQGEEGMDMVKKVQKEGVAGATEIVQDQASEIQEMAMGEIKRWVGVQIKAVSWFVMYFDRIVMWVKSVLDSIVFAATGAIGDAMKSVEEAMGRSVGLVITFLASQLGLGKIGEAIKDILKKVRQPIEKIVNKVVNWIADKVKKLMKKVKGLFKKDKKKEEKEDDKSKSKKFNWDIAKIPIIGENGEKHTLLILEKRGKPILMIRSEEHPVLTFLTFFESEKNKTGGMDSKQSDYVTNIRTKVTNELQPLLDEADKLADENKIDQANIKRSIIIDKMIPISELLGKLLTKETTFATVKEKYLLEGWVGTFGSSPEIVGDDLTPDHQPAGSLLHLLVDTYSFFKSKTDAPNIHEAIQGAKEDGAYTIMLHKYRHEAGRTFKGKVHSVKKSLKTAIDGAINNTMTDQEKREIAIDKLKIELEKDVSAMLNVISKPLKDNEPVWADIYKFPRLTPDEKQQLYDMIKKQITKGEAIILAQPIDKYAH